MSNVRTVPELPISEPVVTTRPPSSVLGLNFDLLGIESMKKELQKLSATNQELLKAFNSHVELPPKPVKNFGSSGNIVLPPDAEDMAKLKKENELLRKRLIELDAQLRAQEQAQKAVPQTWDEQGGEYERLLDEKSEVIRSLHMKVQELAEALRGGPNGPSPDQLDQRQQELEQLERRLRDDEEALQTQAREMEMAMAKERAELARQRADLQRLHVDVNREIEMASRDPGLRDRLMTLQRRPTDGRPKTMSSLPDINLGNANSTPLPPQARRPTTMASIDLDRDAASVQQKTGLFRRLFGG